MFKKGYLRKWKFEYVILLCCSWMFLSVCVCVWFSNFLNDSKYGINVCYLYVMHRVGWCLCINLFWIAIVWQHGGDVNATDHSGQTALHWSAVRGAIQVAELLLQEGARVNAADMNGYQVRLMWLFFPLYLFRRSVRVWNFNYFMCH